MPTTTYGTPYVASSDLVSAYPGTSSTLATRVDDISIKGNGINARTASYVLVLTDAGKNVTMTVAGANTLTVPLNSSVAYPIGTAVGVINLGAGACTITPTGGVTVSGSSLVLAQNEAAQLIKTGTDTWICLKGGGLPKASVSSTTGSPTTSANGSRTAYKWTGSGTVVIGTAGIADVLVVGGGAGGGGANGAGGGAGGYVEQTSIYLAAGTYTVTIGGGGTANGFGTASRMGYLYGIGGGAAFGGIGGSGGGAAQGTTNFGAGVAGQGNNGGNGASLAAGGGGGAGAVGGNAASSVGGNGGAGVSSSITGSPVSLAGGGGGSSNSAQGTGGTGGGGNAINSGTGGNGTANTGGGGGGSYNNTGGAGGSGVVVLLIG